MIISTCHKTNGYPKRKIYLFLVFAVGFCGGVIQGGIAQNCDAVTGNIISNRTFGAGKTGALPNGYLQYLYVTDGCPNDGQYTVADSVSGLCYTKSWHSVPEDHTPGDSKGNMLVVNAPYPGELFRESISGLCTQANYEYSFWMVNLNIEFPPGTCGFAIPNDPDMTIRIETADGRIIDSLKTGTILRTKTPVWRKFSLSFSIPNRTEDTTGLVIRYINNHPGGCGNDFVMDDMVLRQCSDCAHSVVFVPDIFTPNGDGVNDELEVYSANLIFFEFIVYNRWGSAVFASNDPTVKWNGTFREELCPEGVYTWSMKYQFAASQQKNSKNGEVILLR